MTAEDTIISKPSLPWRVASSLNIATVGFLAKCFLNLASTTQVYGLDNFLKLLDQRKDVNRRKRGLLTVSNHLSVIDDPLIWGTLPLTTLLSPTTMRWSLGSADICFRNGPSSILSYWFTLGQTLPCHRYAHSPHGGPYQPTMTQAVRLLSAGPFTQPTPPHPSWPAKPEYDIIDPFSEPAAVHSYSTTGSDAYPAPASYASTRHAWVHIFPEGRVHQHPEHGMRYFKWGVARLILEAEPCPDVVPMFIEGIAGVMPEDRDPPRWLPEVGKRVCVTFGERLEEGVFDGVRERWRLLREREGLQRSGEQVNAVVMDGEEARRLRMEVAKRLRDEIEKIRRARGYPEQDPKSGVSETYAEEGSMGPGRKKDDSIVGDT